MPAILRTGRVCESRADVACILRGSSNYNRGDGSQLTLAASSPHSTSMATPCSSPELVLLFYEHDWLWRSGGIPRGLAMRFAELLSGRTVHTNTSAPPAACPPRLAIVSQHCYSGFGCTMIKPATQFGAAFASSTLRVVIGAERWGIKDRPDVPYDLALESVAPDAGWTWPCDARSRAARVLMPYLLLSLIQNDGADERNITLAPDSTEDAWQRKAHFAAYSLSHCDGSRPNFVAELVRAVPSRRVHALSKRCDVSGATPSPRRPSPRFDEASYLSSIRAALSEYKFGVVFENKLVPGYMTEKLANARLARAVPVWFGSADIYRWVRPSAFVDCTPRGHESEPAAWQRCIADIKFLDGNQTAWEAMVTAPFWVSDAWRRPLTPYLVLMLSLARLGYPRSLERPLPRLPDAYVPRERLPVDVQFEQEERGGQSSVQRWSARGTKHCA